MNATTYTRDGETEYELVYDLPDDESAHVHLVETADGDGAASVSVTLAEFEAEFDEFEESDDPATEYLRERGRNGYGIQ